MTTTIKSSAVRLRKQKGMLTTFTGVMILILLALMMVFATQVGIFDQRISASDLHQKRAFHAAESAIQHAKEYLLPNATVLASAETNLLSNGEDGWLSAGAERWQPCSGAGLDAITGAKVHPCFGEPNEARRDLMYFYSFGGTTELPVATDTLLPGTTEDVSVQALLCLLDIDFDAPTPVQGCSQNTSDPSAAGYVDGSHYMVTLLARGGADCVAGADCKAESLVREQVSNFGGAAGGQSPAVPLTTKSTFPPLGSAEVVANPNAGGVGVPGSVWMNANASCGSGSVIDASEGSWATCEAHEWYAEDALPDDYTCNGNCSCSLAETISNTHGNEDILGIDLIADPNFPCDLFKFYFGVPRTEYEIVKGFAKVVSDCSTLGPGSSGIYWITGNECRINSNTVIGSPKAPVLMVSAAESTTINGTTIIYGVLYISDAENSAAALYSNGNLLVYGQAIIDAAFGSNTGTFQVVYNEFAVRKGGGTGGLGNVIGGWADIHPDWE
ncbi:MAG TPA: hypothetical protein VJN01_05505 [Xanthomonadales bacterium]|nr:hypothetical protein [Xanthomonadales bacterium]